MRNMNTTLHHLLRRMALAQKCTIYTKAQSVEAGYHELIRAVTAHTCNERARVCAVECAKKSVKKTTNKEISIPVFCR